MLRQSPIDVPHYTIPRLLEGLSDGDLLSWGAGWFVNDRDPLVCSMLMAEARGRKNKECLEYFEACQVSTETAHVRQ